MIQRYIADIPEQTARSASDRPEWRGYWPPRPLLPWERDRMESDISKLMGLASILDDSRVGNHRSEQAHQKYEAALERAVQAATDGRWLRHFYARLAAELPASANNQEDNDDRNA